MKHSSLVKKKNLKEDSVTLVNCNYTRVNWNNQVPHTSFLFEILFQNHPENELAKSGWQPAPYFHTWRGDYLVTASILYQQQHAALSQLFHVAREWAEFTNRKSFLCWSLNYTVTLSLSHPLSFMLLKVDDAFPAGSQHNSSKCNFTQIHSSQPSNKNSQHSTVNKQ